MPDRMPDGSTTHLFVEAGALCRASTPSSWTSRKSETTCPACLAVMAERERQRLARQPVAFDEPVVASMMSE